MMMKKKGSNCLLLCLVLLTTEFGVANSLQKHHHRTIIDLTHLITERIAEFSVVRDHIGFGVSLESFDFCLSGQVGTHVNAPAALMNQTKTIDHLNPKHLVNVPGVVIDAPGDEKVLTENRGSVLTRQHLDDWETLHGKIPKHAIVLLRSGWSKFFDMGDKFNGHFEDENDQVFPGFTPAAASWLISARDISGLGTECTDIELGRKTNHRVKMMLAAKSKFSINQLTNLNQLPYTGIHLTVAPLKLERGPGSPARVFAVIRPALSPWHHGKHARQLDPKVRPSNNSTDPNEDSNSTPGSGSVMTPILYLITISTVLLSI